MSPELEQRLRALRDEVEWPATPPLRLELPARERRPALLLRPALTAAVALLLVVLAVVAAVPDVRADVLRWLGIGAVEVRVVSELPPLSDRLDLGTPVTHARAARTRLPIPSSPLLGRPALYASRDAPGGILTARWRDPRGSTLLVSVMRGDGLAFTKKVLAEGDPIEYLSIPGRIGSAAWIPEPHGVAIIDERGGVIERPPRLSASTLIFNDGPLTWRLETSLPRHRAVAVAASLR
jgi:hypothetical protein